MNQPIGRQRSTSSIKRCTWGSEHSPSTNERGASSSLSPNQAKKEPSITASHYFPRHPANPSRLLPTRGRTLEARKSREKWRKKEKKDKASSYF